MTKQRVVLLLYRGDRYARADKSSVEILEGLVQLHGVNVWHLDLQLANLLLDEY